MSMSAHPVEKVNNYILSNIVGSQGLELVDCKSKETIVLEEKEITCEYTLKKSDSDIKVVLTISDPLYFCNVSIIKTEKNHFSLKSYMENINSDSALENLFTQFIDEEISEELYTLGYLNIFANELQSKSLADILSGDYWPEVPLELE